MTREQAQETRAMFWRARQRRGWGKERLASEATAHADDAISVEAVRYYEDRMVAPPKNFAAMRAIAKALGLEWADVLASMGLS